jgi:hypothetical protein
MLILLKANKFVYTLVKMSITQMKALNKLLDALSIVMDAVLVFLVHLIGWPSVKMAHNETDNKRLLLSA